MKAHIKNEWYKKAEYTYCKLKGQLVQAYLKKAQDTKPGSVTSCQKSERGTSAAREQDLIVDAASRQHMVV